MFVPQTVVKVIAGVSPSRTTSVPHNHIGKQTELIKRQNLCWCWGRRLKWSCYKAATRKWDEINLLQPTAKGEKRIHQRHQSPLRHQSKTWLHPFRHPVVQKEVTPIIHLILLTCHDVTTMTHHGQNSASYTVYYTESGRKVKPIIFIVTIHHFLQHSDNIQREMWTSRGAKISCYTSHLHFKWNYIEEILTAKCGDCCFYDTVHTGDYGDSPVFQRIRMKPFSLSPPLHAHSRAEPAVFRRE